MTVTKARASRSRWVTICASSILMAGVLLIGDAVLATPSASAHSALAASTPEFNEELDTAPSAVTLEFVSAIKEVGAVVAVEDESGEDWATGDIDVDTLTATQNVSADMPDGRYLVRWSTVSADGAPLSGTFRFTVGDVPPDPNPLNAPMTSDRLTAVTYISFTGVGALLGLTAYALIATYRTPKRDVHHHTTPRKEARR